MKSMSRGDTMDRVKDYSGFLGLLTGVIVLIVGAGFLTGVSAVLVALDMREAVWPPWPF